MSRRTRSEIGGVVLAVLVGTLGALAVSPSASASGIDGGTDAGAPVAVAAPAVEVAAPAIPPEAHVVPGPALAPMPSVDDPLALASFAASAAAAGRWLVVVSAALVAALALLLRLGGSLHPWLGTDRGRVVVSLVSGVVGIVGAGLAAGQPLTWGLVGAALSATTSAMGLFGASRKVAQ